MSDSHTSFGSHTMRNEEGVSSMMASSPPMASAVESGGDKMDPQVLWWKNAPFLYSGILTHKLEWPSLTVEFLKAATPSRLKNNLSNSSASFFQRVLIGTCTSGQETNYLIIGELRFPANFCFSEDPLRCENYFGYIAPKYRAKQGCSQNPNIPNFETKAKLVHLGDVNRAIHMPQNDFFIATQSSNGQVLFFDYSKHPSYPTDSSICSPQLVLRGHSKEGYGLSWHPSKDGVLASCSIDGTIAIWNVKEKGIKYKTASIDSTDKFFKLPAFPSCTSKLNDNTPTLDPVHFWNCNPSKTAAQNDISFHPLYESILASCDDHGKLNIWDLRVVAQSTNPVAVAKQSNGVSFDCLAFNLHSEYILATGDENGGVEVWDLRLLSKSLLSLNFHSDAITRLHFNGGNAALLGSASQDGTVAVWDLSRQQDFSAEDCENSIYDNARLSKEQNHTIEKPQDKTNALIFVHHAHRGGVTDFCWNYNKRHPLLAASSGWDNRLCCWRMADSALLCD